MNSTEFSKIMDEQFNTCSILLGSKSSEYSANNDRLHNFKQAAYLKGETPLKAAAGMMAKHTISIYDMLMSDAAYPEVVWNEKIADHINYLILIKALIIEENDTKSNQMNLPLDKDILTPKQELLNTWNDTYKEATQEINSVITKVDY